MPKNGFSGSSCITYEVWPSKFVPTCPQDCAQLILTSGQSFDIPCETVQCGVCAVGGAAVLFHLSGLCPASRLDREKLNIPRSVTSCSPHISCIGHGFQFQLRFYVLQSDGRLLGYSKAALQRVEGGEQSWEIRDLATGRLEAATNSTQDFPLGRQAWHIPGCTGRDTRTKTVLTV